MKKSNSLRTFVFVVIAIAVVVLLTLGIRNAISPRVPEDVIWKEYAVQPGDSLWSVVPHDNSYDIRDIVKMVADYNEIEDYNLIPYTVIYVPEWE